MSDAALLEAADLNLAEFNRAGARDTDGGIVHEEEGLLFFLPAHRFPFGFTGVMRMDSRVPAGETLERARTFFAPHGHGYTHVLMLHRDADLAAALDRAGVQPIGDSPGMVLEERLDDVTTADDVSIDPVANADDVAAFGRVSGSAYTSLGMPESVGVEAFATERSLVGPDRVGLLARIDGRPVAAAMCLVSHGVAGVYWVGTVPDARGRGLAEACTRAATNAGFDRGARFAALQASQMGAPLYLRMGYRTVTRYPWYTVAP